MRPTGKSFWAAAAAILALGLPGSVVWAQSSAVGQLLAEADAAYDQSEWKKAAAAYDRAIAQEPTGVAVGAYGKRATIFLIQKQYAAGIAWIEQKAEKTYPGNVEVLEPKALMLMAIGKPAETKRAVELGKEIIAKNPNMALTQHMLGDYYAKAGGSLAADTITAFEAFLRARSGALAPLDKKVRVQLGLAYLHRGDREAYKKAGDHFEAALKLRGPGYLDANSKKGLCAVYTAQGKWETRMYDKAITMCESVVAARKALKGDPSTYYNLGLAYLGRGNAKKALEAANAYRQSKRDHKGFMLLGQVYFVQSRTQPDRLDLAEEQFRQAEQIADAAHKGEVARWLGKVYLNKRPPQPKKAIERLVAAMAGGTADVAVYVDLAEAYLVDRQPGQAATTAEKGLAQKGQERNVELLVLAGDGYYEAGELENALARYRRALEANRRSSAAKDGVSNTLWRQAHVLFKKEDFAGAEKVLRQALEVNPQALEVRFNLGVLALHQGHHKDAIKYLETGREDLRAHRLLGKAYLGLGNKAKAIEHYGKAEDEARKVRNMRMLAEIYTEWSPLLLEAGKVEDAVEKLEQAAAVSAGQPYDRATRRNLQVAYYVRGYKRLRARQAAEAVADLERATREPALLKGDEEAIFTFALGLAYLSANQEEKGGAIFEKFAKKPGAVSWLKAPYDKIGSDLFLAYAQYRQGTGASRHKAAAGFQKLQGKASGGLQARLRELLRSTWELIAYDNYARGSAREAEAALKKAAGLAGGDKRTIEHNLAVLSLEKKGAGGKETFERMGDRPPEALVNLGILADRAGDAKKAFDLWSSAKAKGVRSAKLDDWIEAKKRIFGY